MPRPRPPAERTAKDAHGIRIGQPDQLNRRVLLGRADGAHNLVRLGIPAGGGDVGMPPAAEAEVPQVAHRRGRLWRGSTKGGFREKKEKRKKKKLPDHTMPTVEWADGTGGQSNDRLVRCPRFLLPPFSYSEVSFVCFEDESRGCRDNFKIFFFYLIQASFLVYQPKMHPDDSQPLKPIVILAADRR